MTEKLYYADSHMAEFSARVLSCEQGEKGYLTVLDKTAFFPEGGGQAADTGFIGESAVLDTQEKSGVIYTFATRPSRQAWNITAA